MADTFSHAFRKTARFLLSLLLVFSVAATLLAFVLRYIFFNRTSYTKAAHAPAVIESVHAALLNSLESECLFYDLPFETIKTAVSKEVVETLVTTQTSAVYDALFDGTPLPKVQWDPTTLAQTIQTFFDTLPEQDRPSDTAAQTIADDLINSLSPILNIGLSDKLLKQGHGIVQKLLPLQSFSSLAVLWLLLSVALALGLWWVTPKGTAQRLQSVFGMTFFGSSVVAVPLWLLCRYDFPSQLVLGESALKQYINGVLYQIIDYSVILSSVVFCVSAVLLIAAVITKIIPRKPETTP